MVDNEKDAMPPAPAAESEPAGRDFRAFLLANPESNKYHPTRKDAMRVGDYIEMPMSEFKSWVAIPIATSEKMLSEPSTDDRVVKVRIVEIEAGDSIDPHIVVEADGIRKTVYGSLFFNRFAPHSTDVDELVTKDDTGYYGVFGPPGDSTDGSG